MLKFIFIWYIYTYDDHKFHQVRFAFTCQIVCGSYMWHADLWAIFSCLGTARLSTRSSKSPCFKRRYANFSPISLVHVSLTFGNFSTLLKLIAISKKLFHITFWNMFSVISVQFFVHVQFLYCTLCHLHINYIAVLFSSILSWKCTSAHVVLW